MKKGIFNVGKAVKNSTVKGYNYVKGKKETIKGNNNDDKTKEDEIHDEVFKNERI